MAEKGECPHCMFSGASFIPNHHGNIRLYFSHSKADWLSLGLRGFNEQVLKKLIFPFNYKRNNLRLFGWQTQTPAPAFLFVFHTVSDALKEQIFAGWKAAPTSCGNFFSFQIGNSHLICTVEFVWNCFITKVERERGNEYSSVTHAGQAEGRS